MSSIESLPYRPCAGIMVLNRDGLVFIGRRNSGPEHIDTGNDWQMPQGGVDEGEDTYKAALRELYEETNIRSVEKLGEVVRSQAPWIVAWVGSAYGKGAQIDQESMERYYGSIGARNEAVERHDRPYTY